VEQRFLKDDELSDARTLIGWQFWAGPISSSVFLLAFALYAAHEGDAVGILLLLGILGILPVAFWLIRVRQYKRFTADIEARIVNIVQGVPEHVRLTRGGRCYLSVEGRDICVPNEYYKKLQEANAAKIEFLPMSRLATKVTVIRGIGIGV